MERFASELGLGNQMAMRDKRKPVRVNTVNTDRGRETMGSLMTSEWVVCLARAQGWEVKQWERGYVYAPYLLASV